MPDLDVKALRDRLGLGRPGFADAYGIPIRTLQDWEQDRRQPDATARAYLAVIAADPEGVKEARAKGQAEPVRTAAPPHPVPTAIKAGSTSALASPSGVRIRIGAPKVVTPEPTPDERARALLQRIARDEAGRDRPVRIKL